MKTRATDSLDTLRTTDCRALTILEMLVSTAMLAFIVLGLTAMFVQTQKAFKTGVKQSTITDAGRTIIDMMASDLSQMADPHFTNVYYPSNNLGGCPPNLYWSSVSYLQFYQTNNGSYTLRTNQTQDIFCTVLTNNVWTGIGYTVSNWFLTSNGGAVVPFPGVGTLYRYEIQTNEPLYSNNWLYNNFSNQVYYNSFTNSLFYRIADGVVHLKIDAYDADGNEMYWEPYYDQSGETFSFNRSFLQYPEIMPIYNSGNTLIAEQTNYLPHSIDIELGILEPEALEHARALFASGAINAASNYLYNATGQVETFRQHIIILAAP